MMSTATTNTNVKQIKAASNDRINGKIKLQNNKSDAASSGSAPSSNAVVNGSTTTSAGAPSNGSSSGAVAKSMTTQGGGQPEQLSPEQRKRVSGRGAMTAEEQKMALRKRVCLSDATVDDCR
jgi:hypothetical protein